MYFKNYLFELFSLTILLNRPRPNKLAGRYEATNPIATLPGSGDLRPHDVTSARPDTTYDLVMLDMDPPKPEDVARQNDYRVCILI